MASSTDQLVRFAVLLFSALAAVLLAVVALVRSDRVPGPPGSDPSPPHAMRR